MGNPLLKKHPVIIKNEQKICQSTKKFWGGAKNLDDGDAAQKESEDARSEGGKEPRVAFENKVFAERRTDLSGSQGKPLCSKRGFEQRKRKENRQLLKQNDEREKRTKGGTEHRLSRKKRHAIQEPGALPLVEPRKGLRQTRWEGEGERKGHHGLEPSRRNHLHQKKLLIFKTPLGKTGQGPMTYGRLNIHAHRRGPKTADPRTRDPVVGMQGSQMCPPRQLQIRGGGKRKKGTGRKTPPKTKKPPPQRAEPETTGATQSPSIQISLLKGDEAGAR